MPGEPVTRICQAYPDRVEVRGRDLTGDLMGRLTFTQYFHLLLTGEEPTAEQTEFLDLLLVAIAEHGMMPTNVAARMTLAADPGALQGAVAAGLLGAGPVILGTAESCAQLLARTQAEVEAGADPADAAPGLAIRCTIRSIPAPSASLDWRPSGAWPARTCCWRTSSATRWRPHGGGRWS
jgi:citrate synthase